MSPPQTDLRLCKGIKYLSFLISEAIARSTITSQATSLLFFNSKLNVKNERENVNDQSAKAESNFSTNPNLSGS